MYPHPRFTRATVVCDSVCEGRRITTLLCHYPWPIHSEVLRHRILSHSVASSRAIPLAEQIKAVRNEPYVPYKWGKNQKGMIAMEELPEEVQRECVKKWLELRDTTVLQAEWFAAQGVHKENPSQFLKGFGYTDDLITGTEWENFFNLRIHPAAREEINALAKAIRQAMEGSTPVERNYHLPFVETHGEATSLEDLVLSKATPPASLRQPEPGVGRVAMVEGMTGLWGEIEGPAAVAFVSAARCARLSYGKLDGAPLDVAEDFRRGYAHAAHGHSSVLEHQAFAYSALPKQTPKLASNFARPWVQFRKLIQGEAVFPKQEGS